MLFQCDKDIQRIAVLMTNRADQAAAKPLAIGFNDRRWLNGSFDAFRDRYSKCLPSAAEQARAGACAPSRRYS